MTGPFLKVVVNAFNPGCKTPFYSMKLSKTQTILALIAAAITIIGLVTGKFLFLVVWLPLGFLFKKKKEEE